MANFSIFRFSTSQKVPDPVAVFLENARAKRDGRDLHFGYDEGQELFFAKEGGAVRYCKDRARVIFLYRDGFAQRADFLFNSYCLSNITFSKDDIVLDCGANSGDLSLKICELIDPANYIAIEPNPDDIQILKHNIPKSSKLVAKALGNTEGKLDFYVATSEADSSLVRPKEFDSVITVDVTRLDTLLDEMDIPKVKLLKLEAEGFEPEILEGLGDRLSSVEYIAADGGYERGEAQEQTFTAISNYLLANGFEMVDIFFKWGRALYRNTRFAA